MANIEIITMLNELTELEALIKEAQEQADSIRDTVKQEMTERNVTELTAGDNIVRWTPTVSKRLDTARFKRTMPELYESLTRTVQSRRFTISKL